MKQVSQNFKNGEVKLEDVNPPALKRGGVLVRPAFSVISQGTEGMLIKQGQMNLIEKAKARPDQVKKVIQSVQQQGLKTTMNKVKNRLEALNPMGYSMSGIVEAVGEGAEEFEVGQRVACAGAGYANHAELNFIPKNLVVPVPDEVALEDAAYATMGSIAMHGFRQGEMNLGETAVVVGLGLVGQLVVQLAKAAGMQVFGIDLDESRCQLALDNGAIAADKPDSEALQNQITRATGGFGADCVFLAVASNSNAPLEGALELLRDRGRVVFVGKTGMDLPYNECFKKEVEFRFSRSYGPGRYDANYEERGIDYPIGYVRWSEKRNLQGFVDLLAQNQLNMSSLTTHTFPFHEAEDVYAKVMGGGLQGSMGVLFQYPDAPTPLPELKVAPAEVKKGGRIGVIGAGNYASAMLLPHLKNHAQAELVEVATATSLSAENAARKFNFVRSGTDYKKMLAADDVDTVLIATRHASHASFVAEALRAGKQVFVEKPLAINTQGLQQVEEAVTETGNDRLMVGFNRRFAPIVTQMKQKLAGAGPFTMTYRVMAGQVDKGSWLESRAEGSRFVGEAGHFFDVFNYLTESLPVAVSAHGLRPAKATNDDLENLSVSVSYADGSVANLVYITQGSPRLPKEWLEVNGAMQTLQMDNFNTLHVYPSAGKPKEHKGFGGNKGQAQQLDAFVDAINTGGAMPIALNDLLATTKITLAAEEALRGRRVVIL